MHTLEMSVDICTSHTSHVDYPKMVNPSYFTWLCTLRGSFVFVSLQQHCDFNGKGCKAFNKQNKFEKCLQASTVGWDKLRIRKTNAHIEDECGYLYKSYFTCWLSKNG